ncbi:MAG: Holliday junction resolvase RuvX [Capnocytophaga sp.]|nr:Holliday junction resolvase RuvX [Capnocytophaga sp.]
MPRIIAIDYGTKRCGIAATDPLQIIASGLLTVETPKLLDFVKKYVTDENVETIVIGKPKQMNNEDSQSEPYIASFVEKLKTALPQIHIVREDERFTSKMAFQTMIDSGLKKKQRQNKALVDEISATLILQSYLQHR